MDRQEVGSESWVVADLDNAVCLSLPLLITAANRVFAPSGYIYSCCVQQRELGRTGSVVAHAQLPDETSFISTYTCSRISYSLTLNIY